MSTNWDMLANELCRFPPKATSSDAGNRTVRKVILNQTDFPDIFLVRKKFLGYPVLDTGTLVRYLPWKDPDDPTQFAVQMDHQGFMYKGRSPDDETDWPFTTAFEPKYWVCTIQFERPLYPIGERESVTDALILGETPLLIDGGEVQRYCKKRIHQSRELATPIKGQFWVSGRTDGDPRILVEFPVPVAIPKSHVEVIWYHIPTAACPFTAIKAAIRTVNDDVLILPDIPDGEVNYAAQTLQLEGMESEDVVLADGSLGLNIHYSFVCRSGLGSNGSAITFNTLPDAGGVFRKVYRSNDTTVTTSIWDTSNYSLLFRPEP